MCLRISNMKENNRSPSGCLACSCRNTNKFIVENGYDIYRCGNCGLLFVHPIPDMDALKELYRDVHQKLTPEMWKHHSAHVFASVIEQIKHVKPSGKSLDVGAGSGDFVELMAANGYDALGIEIAEEPVREAKERGINMIQGVLSHAGFEANSFDIVTLWWVLEHVADPFAMLAEASRILKIGGLLAFRVPNIRFILQFQCLRHISVHLPGSSGSHMINPVSHKHSFFEILAAPYHLWGYTQDAVRIMLARLGFDAVEVSLKGRNLTDGTARETLEKLLYTSGRITSRLLGARHMTYHDMNVWAVKGAGR